MKLAWLSTLFLAGCPAHDDTLGSTGGDDDTQVDAPTGSTTCEDPAVDVEEFHVESCELRGLDSAPVAELAATSDGDVYILTTAGSVERFAPVPGPSCTFEQVTSYVPPKAHVASIDGSSDGRLYATYRDGTMSVLDWGDARCTSTTPFRPQLAAAGDGSVVLAPASGNGLVVVDTASCNVTSLGFVSTEQPRVFGRVGSDIVWNDPAATGIGRVALDGTVVYRIPDHGLGGNPAHTIEPLGTRIAGWALGFLFSVDAATGGELPAIKYDRFSTMPRDAANAAIFDATPDGATGYVLAASAACTYLYRLTPAQP